MLNVYTNYHATNYVATSDFYTEWQSGNELAKCQSIYIIDPYFDLSDSGLVCVVGISHYNVQWQSSCSLVVVKWSSSGSQVVVKWKSSGSQVIVKW